MNNNEEDAVIAGTGATATEVADVKHHWSTFYPTYDELQTALLDLWDTAVPVSQERAREINEMCVALSGRAGR